METLATMAASAQPATIDCDQCTDKFTSSAQYEMHLAKAHASNGRPRALKLAVQQPDDKTRQIFPGIYALFVKEARLWISFQSVRDMRKFFSHAKFLRYSRHFISVISPS